MSSQPPLNVVFILTDDQGPWAMGCAGNDEIRTPHLDRLAAAGMRFENFFCTSPVCSPARASLLSGRIPSQHGVHDYLHFNTRGDDPATLDDFVCYTDILAEHGYTCGLVGKWHLGESIRPQHGFTDWFTLPGGGCPYNDARVIRNGEAYTSSGYLTDIFGDEAVRFIEENQDGPFYLSLHFTAPHAPWDGHPQEIVDSYDACPFKSCPQEYSHPWLNTVWERHVGNRDSLKGYFAAITALDANVGRVLDTLDRLALTERTLVVFMSDNGFSCGQRGIWGKGNGTVPLNMYENSVKVPAIFAHPERIPAASVSSAMVSQYDFMPTLLEYLGLPASPDESLPGVSFVEVLEGRAEEAREDVVVFDEYGPVRMIRTREWKYIHRFPFGPHELYHLAADPEERQNLVDEPAQAERLAALRQRLAAWFNRYVVPMQDGARFPVCGDGQVGKIGPGHPGESAFSQGRLQRLQQNLGRP